MRRVEPQIGNVDQRTVGQHHCAAQGRDQLANIAGPRIGQHRRHCRRREPN
jgi:hypothetical protein